MYLSDGFRVSSVWDLYSNGTTSGKVMLLARGMSSIIGQVEFVYVSYTDEGLNVAQEKINMSLSDGFHIFKVWVIKLLCPMALTRYCDQIRARML